MLDSADDPPWLRKPSRQPPTALSLDGSPVTVPSVPSASAFTLDVLGQHFGDHELLAEVGRGGMGVVFKARQLDLNRLVALKMILPGSLPTEDDLQRFRTEAESTARLQHPHIVAVFGVGELEGRHFYSMEFIDGPSLAQRLAKGPLPGRSAARYLVTIARAIHHAHGHGILHRDLKPSNILFDAEDQPHVTDFGLAKKIGGDSRQTRTGAILGTPSYMAPEQAQGKNRELGPACDVYGLGALLYEMLTGRPPFRSETPVDTLMHVLEREPAPPRLLNPKIDRDLETICLKCLEKETRDRYASAEALALDLERYLNGDAISAHSVNMLDRLARTFDRVCAPLEVDFLNWGNVVLGFAGIVFATQVIIFLLMLSGPPYPLPWLVLTRTFQFLGMVLVFWRFRARHALHILPVTAAERQLWSIWIGYLAGSIVVALVTHNLGGIHVDELTLFPLWSVLSGLAFFAMGGNYWGRCYLLGIVFFGAALLMPLHLHSAPLVFGTVWGASLLLIGLRMRRMGAEAGNHQNMKKNE
jgi:serine/threonine-protein kinase